MGLAEGGHSCHANSVLDDPEQVRVPSSLDPRIGEKGRARIEPCANDGTLSAWGIVTGDAHIAVTAKAGPDSFRIVKERNRHVLYVNGNRTIADQADEMQGQGPMCLCRGDIKDAAPQSKQRQGSAADGDRDYEPQTSHDATASLLH